MYERWPVTVALHASSGLSPDPTLTRTVTGHCQADPAPAARGLQVRQWIASQCKSDLAVWHVRRYSEPKSPGPEELEMTQLLRAAKCQARRIGCWPYTQAREGTPEYTPVHGGTGATGHPSVTSFAHFLK